jgi:hypothetical protein
VRNGKIHVELLGKIRSSKELDQSNFARSRSIDFYLIDRNFPELTFA